MLTSIADKLSSQVESLQFASPVTHVYNPLRYARDCHHDYLRRYGSFHAPILLLGMNPGPFGMAQTGVPFGEVHATQRWLNIQGIIKQPASMHPKRPVLGFESARSEVSGRRLWAWAQQRYDTPQAFFRSFFVSNYCPLLFLEESGRNRTPDKLPKNERVPLFEACDQALQQTVLTLQPQWVIGVGRFATTRAQAALKDVNVNIGTILHPSPASPAANRGWAEQAEAQLQALGIRLPARHAKVPL